MGFYSYFTLTAEDAEGRNVTDRPDLMAALVGITKTEEGYWDASDGEIRSNGETKWYDHQEDLEALSKALPALRFTLFVEGEDGAQSYIYARAGAVQRCDGEMTFPPRTIW